MRDVYLQCHSSGLYTCDNQRSSAVNISETNKGTKCCYSSQVIDIWYSAVPGDEVTKTCARESLSREWKARFRVPSTDYEEVKLEKPGWAIYLLSFSRVNSTTAVCDAGRGTARFVDMCFTGRILIATFNWC